MRYLLLTAHASPHEDEAALIAANEAMLRRAVPYRDTPRAGRSAAWPGWLYEVAWRGAPPVAALPDPAGLAAAPAASVERERPALTAHGGHGELRRAACREGG